MCQTQWSLPNPSIIHLVGKFLCHYCTCLHMKPFKWNYMDLEIPLKIQPFAHIKFIILRYIVRSSHTLISAPMNIIKPQFRLMRTWCDTISYPLFADADTGIYPHAALQYHARPKAKRGIAMLSVDKFLYPRKQTRGNEFIPCSNNICDILKRFRSFNITAITWIWPKSLYKHSVTRSYRSGKESGRRSESPLWRHQWRFFVFISHADDVKREIRLHISRLLTNQKRESARSMGYIMISQTVQK